MDCYKRKDLVIKGYEHPESLNSDRSSQYKLYSSTGRKKSDMAHFKNTSTGNPYASVSTPADSDEFMCPVCSVYSVDKCFCSYSDKTCPNGHIWYTNRKGEVVVGNPHK